MKYLIEKYNWKIEIIEKYLIEKLIEIFNEKF